MNNLNSPAAASPIRCETIARLSADHLPRSDFEALKQCLAPETDLDLPHWWFDAGTIDFAAYPVAAGWIVEIRAPYAIRRKDDNSKHLSDAFFSVLGWASSEGITTLRFDFDIEPNEHLPRFP